jgi:hypothetical protein
VLLVDAHGKVCWLSATHEGRVHDKRVADEAHYTLPSGSHLLQDLGFQGFALAACTIHQPTKKPRGQQLTEDQRLANRAISSLRMRVEHVIASIKRFRIVKDKLRLWKDDLCDDLIEICCALHNFRLNFRSWSTVTL